MLYILRVNLYRNQNKFKNPIDKYQEFRAKNLIDAREQCFNKYQSYIDVLLESIGEEYSNYQQAKESLSEFLFSGKTKTKLGLPFNDDTGISISLVYDDTVETQKEVTINNKTQTVTVYKEEICIHGLENYTNCSQQEMENIYFKNLKKEAKIFLNNGFETKNFNRKLHILKTPINY